MVRNASRALKIGVHLAFDTNFDMEIGTFYPEKFRLAYYAVESDFKCNERDLLIQTGEV